MDSSYSFYNYVRSFERIDEILALPAGSFEERDTLPARDELTYTNGFYVNKCAALFVDIRDSSTLPDIYKRPALAKIYRAFISEMVAVFKGHDEVREINIVGDCVWGVYSAAYKVDIDNLLSTAAKGNSLIKVLNYKLQKAGFTTPIKVGFGLAFGRVLMIKAGYKGSGIADVVYMGDVVNEAAKLASQAGKGWEQPLFVDADIYNNLNDEYKTLLQAKGWPYGVYTGDVVNIAMEDWYQANCT